MRHWMYGLIGLVTLTACDSLDRFTTGSGEAYCGSIVRGSSFRTGFSPRVQMRLTLDASVLDTTSSPGNLSTYETEGESEVRLFDNTELRVIPTLLHDSISQLEFGNGREKNSIFAISPTEGESALAFVSLMADNTVEVRIVRGGLDSNESTSNNKTLFGIFSLSKQSGDCDF